jgi:hypothetical protein
MRGLEHADVLFDPVLMMQREELDAQRQFIFRGLDRLDPAAPKEIAACHPATVHREVEAICAGDGTYPGLRRLPR